jgi:putative transposase
MRIREIAQTRVRYGYRKIRVLLNREGWKVGKYLVERIYREEGLTLHQRRKRRRRVAEHRELTAGTVSPYRTKPGVVDGLCSRSVDGREKVPLADDRGYLHAGMLGD